MKLSDFAVPATGAATAARSLASRYQSAALTAHAIRSWLWAEAIAATEHITDVDHELLYVASMLHDIGTVTEFDNHTLSYEDADRSGSQSPPVPGGTRPANDACSRSSSDTTG